MGPWASRSTKPGPGYPEAGPAYAKNRPAPGKRWPRLPESRPRPRRPKARAPPAPAATAPPETAPAPEGGRHPAVWPFLGRVTRKPAAGPRRAPLLQTLGPCLGAGPGRARSGVRFGFPTKGLVRAGGRNQLAAPPAGPGRGPGHAAHTARPAGARRPCHHHGRPRSPSGPRVAARPAGGVTRKRAPKPGRAYPEALPPKGRAGCPAAPYAQVRERLPGSQAEEAGQRGCPGRRGPNPAKPGRGYPEAARPQTNHQPNPTVPPISHPRAAVI